MIYPLSDFFIQNLACGGSSRSECSVLTPYFTVVALKMWAYSPSPRPKSPKTVISCINSPLRENSIGSIEKLEYKPSCMQWHYNCFESYMHCLIAFLFSQTSTFESVTKKKIQKKTSHFSVYRRRMTHDAHHTRHSDRGGPCHFCTLWLFGSDQ